MTGTSASIRTGQIRGFTLVEVMIASVVLISALVSSLMVLQMGMRAVDTARTTTLAGQVLQSQMEKLRLLTWEQLQVPAAESYFSQGALQDASAQLKRFSTADGGAATFGQSIVAAPAPFAATVRIITLTATWTGVDGLPHSVSYTTRYAQKGISDFFYTSH